MPPAKVEPWILELSAYGFGGTASGMLRSTSLDRSRYQIPGAMGCCRQESVLARLSAVISATGHQARRAEVQQFPSGA
jgi:hypothetical protein